MEGFGFSNFEESFETSSPPTYTSEPYGFNAAPSGRSSKQTANDMYDFDVSHDEETPKKPARTRSVRRMSTDDRINEILEKSKLSKPAAPPTEETEDDTYNSWKNSWNQLMEGVGGESPKHLPLEDSTESVPHIASSSGRAKVKDRSLNASDSLDISDADFEVGVHAARRSMEKSSERRRRSAMDTLPSKLSASPDLGAKTNRRSTLAVGRGADDGPELSSALSSISVAGDGPAGGTAGGGGMMRYGSVGGKSDGDLLKILAETRPQFRSPVDESSLHIIDDDDLTPTHSKRRQQQLNRRSLSPSVSTNAMSSKRPATHDDSHSDSRSEGAPEYSLDDFDADTPVKRISSPPPEPPQALDADRPPASTIAAGPGQLSHVDDIKQRWLQQSAPSLSSMKMFASVDEGDNEDTGDAASAEAADSKKSSPSSAADSLVGRPAATDIKSSGAPPVPQYSDSEEEDDRERPEEEDDEEEARAPAPPRTSIIANSRPVFAQSNETGTPLRPAEESGMTASLSSPPPPPAPEGGEPTEAEKTGVPAPSGVRFATNSLPSNPYSQQPQYEPPYHQHQQYQNFHSQQQPPTGQSDNYQQHPYWRSQPQYSGPPPYQQSPHNLYQDQHQQYQQRGHSYHECYPRQSSSAEWHQPANGEAPHAQAQRESNSLAQFPSASEISPRQVLLSHSGQRGVGQFAPTSRLTDLTRGIGGDGGDLPVVPPSATELHAHIAAVAMSDKHHQVDRHQVSSSVKLLKSKGARSNGNGRNQSARPPSATDSSAAAPGADMNSIRRIEIGNSRLLRQFEELDKEIRAMKAEKTRPRPRPPKRDSKTTTRLTSEQTGDERESRPTGPREQEVRASAVAVAASERPWDAPVVGDYEALQAIKMIFHESVDKEALLRERENALNIRESMLENTQKRLFQAQSVPSGSVTSEHAARVSELEAQLETLKAELYRAQGEEENLRQALAVREEKQRARVEAGGDEALPQNGGGEGTGDSGKSVDALTREVRDLEHMVAMYEKENARLAEALVLRDKEMKALRAEFFDKQEGLVKEINKLRNKQHDCGTRSDVASSLDLTKRNFESELERDALFRNMSEQIMLLEKSSRKKDETIADMVDSLNAVEREKIVLEKALGQLHKGPGHRGGEVEGPTFPEMSTLQPRSANDAAAHNVDISSMQQLFSEQRMKHEAEVDALRSKLQWYAETQQLVDEAVRERDMYKREVEQLRDRTGLVGGGGGSANTSLMSTGGGNAQKRNPADIRRIRELEKALDAAREGIQKRFPDSVANLLYAAIPASRGDDGASAADLQQVVRERDDLRAELAKTQSESQLLVTSLRQEYERLKLDFQRQLSRVKDGTVQPPQATADVGGGAPDMDPWDAQTGGQSVKTFAQAKDRIRYLEVENSRVRSFYAKKVESLQNKYLAQLAAIRRGTGADAKEEREKAKDVVLSATERSSLMQRVALLEDELLRTAEELGQVKAASAAGLPHMTPPSHPAVASDVPPPPVTAAAPNATDVNTERSVEFTKEERRYLTTEVTALRDRVRELSDQLEVARRATQDLSVGARAGEVTSHAPAAETTQQRELEALQETSALMTQKLRDSEQEQVRAAGQLREMQLRHEYDLSQKDNEIQNAHAELRLLREQLNKPLSPEMHNFKLIESRVNELELRLKRREKELGAALEDCRASEHMERMRLQAIHEQELREKDESILAFQRELELLIGVLKQEGRAAVY